jgi:hypothetical protein
MNQVRISVWDIDQKLIYNGNINNIPLNYQYVEIKAKKIYNKICATKMAAIEQLIREEFFMAISLISKNEHCCSWHLLPQEIQNSIRFGNNIVNFKMVQD